MISRRLGVLLLHGFGGTPQGLGDLPQMFADAGFATRVPTLPGHGTSVADLAEYRWDDWLRAARAEYESLVAECDLVVLVGLSMGGHLPCGSQASRTSRVA